MSSDKRDFDSAAATWDEKPARVKLASDVAAAIREQVKPARSMKALDFGCGTGLLTLALAPLVKEITGADSSKKMLEVLSQKVAAQGLTNVRTLRVDLDAGDTLPGPFDLVTVSMTAHHVQNISVLLAAFYQCLGEGGTLALADLDEEGGLFHEDATGVFHEGFNRHALAEAFTGEGFADVTVRTAAEIVKPGADGRKRTFTVFLMTGTKKA
ncbi:MAG: class I SAM-dependent methyltransferase [Thermodesulfobacteriota bacterium]